MSAAEMMAVGRRLPRIRSVTFRSGFEVAVSWTSATRGGATEIVDLSPIVFRLKFYAPLRDDEVLRRSVHVFEEGAGIAWGERAEIDMAAGSVLRLVEEAEGARLPAEQDPVPPRTEGRTAAA